MKGDFTRSTFDPKKHYSSVRMQQGRLQLDADWNEQVDIQAHLNQAQIRDLIGLSGVPKSKNNEKGFEISCISSKKDFKIACGRIYVDGILCELDQDITYASQPDYPNALWEDLEAENLQGEKSYIAYLDVWQRHITSVDDPQIREVALNNVPDTATRTKTVWQVKLLPVPKDNDATKTWQDFVDEQNERTIFLTPKVSNGANLENHLYRIEIHEAGKAEEATFKKVEEATFKKPEKATFKWSRDNGFLVSAIDKIDGNIITIRQNNNEAWQLARPRQWVEIIRSDQTENWELAGRPGILARLQRVSDNKLIIEPGSIKKPKGVNYPGKFDKTKTDKSESRSFKIRLWDYTSDAGEKGGILIPADNSEYIPLEGEGIEIKFTGSGNYQTGDYWLIPTRSNRQTPLDWPTEGENALYQNLPPKGIKHHYSRLALITLTDKQKLQVHDCRQPFISLIDVLDRLIDVFDILEGRNIIDELNVGPLQFQDKNEQEAEGTISQQVSSDVSFRYSGEGFEKLGVGDTIIVKESASSNKQQVRSIKTIDRSAEILTINQPFKPPLDNLDQQKFSYQKPLVRFVNPQKENPILLNALGLEVKGKIEANDLELTGEQSSLKVNTILSNELGIGIDDSDRLEADLYIEAASDKQSITIIKDSEANTQLIVTAEGNVAIGKEIPTQGSKLEVEGKIKATALELPPEGTLEAGTFRGENLELGTRQDQDSFLSYGLIQAEEVDSNQQISFTAESDVPFVFFQKQDGQRPTQPLVVIDERLKVNGIVDAQSLLVQGSESGNSPLARFSDSEANTQLIVTAEGNVAIGKEIPTQGSKLEVEGKIKATALELPPEGTLEAGTFRGQGLELGTRQDQNSFLSYGLIQAEEVDSNQQISNQQISFTAESDVPFVFFQKQDGQRPTQPLVVIDERLKVNGIVDAQSLLVQGSGSIAAEGTISNSDSDLVTVAGDGTTFTNGQEGSLIIVANGIRRIREFRSPTEVVVDLPFSEPLLGESFAVVSVQAVTISPSPSSQTSINANGDIPPELTENDVIIAAGQIRIVISVTEASNEESSNEFTIDIPFDPPLTSETYFAILKPLSEITVSEEELAIAIVEGNFPTSLATGDFIIAAKQLRTVEKIDSINNSFTVTPPFSEPLEASTNLFILPKLQGTITTAIKVTGNEDVNFNEIHVGDLLSIGTGETEQTRLITRIIDQNKLTINAPFDSALIDADFSYQQPIARFVDSNQQPQLIINAEGNVGIGTSIPTEKLQVDGSVLINGDLRYEGELWHSSSRSLKTDITELSNQEASQILRELNPVKFNYKNNQINSPHLGFIAEEVPDSVASSDKKSICPVDIVAVLTKNVQEQQQAIIHLAKIAQRQKQEIAMLQENFQKLLEALPKTNK